MRGTRALSAIIITTMLCLATIDANALDYPHSTINNIGCDSCHYVYSDEPSYMPP